MKNIHILCFAIFLFIISIDSYSKDQDSVSKPRKFINLSIIGDFFTDEEDPNITTNNISLGLIYGHSKNIRGLSIAPFNKVDSSMYGLQIGLSNGASEVRGLQIGMVNGTNNLKGMQIGMANFIHSKSGGLQIGIFNYRISRGLQIGIANYAKHNDFPIGIINIIDDGDMNVGFITDEMSNVLATFRSGGKYLYGVVGLGYSFASSLNQLAVEAGFGAHLLRTERFKINTEITITNLSRTYVHYGNDKDYEEKLDNFDFKNAFRVSARLLPSLQISKKIGMFGGPTINYMQSQSQENQKIFPSHYMWRKFNDKSLKQIYLGWIVGIQYRLK